MAIKGPQGRSVAKSLKVSKPKLTMKANTMDQLKHYIMTDQPLTGREKLLAVRTHK